MAGGTSVFDGLSHGGIEDIVGSRTYNPDDEVYDLAVIGGSPL